MKRFTILLAGLLLLTACSPHAVQDVFQGPQAGPNMLEIQLFDQTYDLGGSAASVIDAMNSSGLIIYDYLTYEQYGRGGKYATKEQRISPRDAAYDPDKLVYFHYFPSSYWNQRAEFESAKKYGIPQNGVEVFQYVFSCRKENGEGSLYNFTSADGLTISSSADEFSAYLKTGTFGMPISTFETERNTHYFMVAADGQPVDLAPYVEALPESLSDEMIEKGNLFIIGSPFRESSLDNAEMVRENLENEYISSQECRNFCAVMNAYYDKLQKVNSRQITNLAIIDFAFVDGVLDGALYCVIKVDAYNPR